MKKLPALMFVARKNVPVQVPARLVAFEAELSKVTGGFIQDLPKGGCWSGSSWIDD